MKTAALKAGQRVYAPWPVFVLATQAVCTTLAAVTAIGVLGSGMLTRLIPEMAQHKIAAVLFAGMGILTWFDKI